MADPGVAIPSLAGSAVSPAAHRAGASALALPADPSLEPTAAPRAHHDATCAPGPFGRGLLAAIRGYQRFSATRPPRCRYLPTCSEYTVEAITVHGTARGLWLGMRRIGRCHPFGSHGLDPVPPRD